jgi:hypothetical protein
MHQPHKCFFVPAPALFKRNHVIDHNSRAKDFRAFSTLACSRAQGRPGAIGEREEAISGGLIFLVSNVDALHGLTNPLIRLPYTILAGLGSGEFEVQVQT